MLSIILLWSDRDINVPFSQFNVPVSSLLIPKVPPVYKTKTRLSSNDSTNAPDLERVRSITEVNLRLKILVQRYIFKISLFAKFLP